jgi:hypothetical protein
VFDLNAGVRDMQRICVRLGAALAAAAVLAVPALADTMTMTRPIEAASLHDGPLDMVAYYVPVDGGALEVTATFAEHEPQPVPEPAEPMRIVMALGDGDDVAFSMPGYPQALYRFLRAGDAVTVSVRKVDPTIISPRKRTASAR